MNTEETQILKASLIEKIGKSLCVFEHGMPVSCVCVASECKTRFLCVKCILNDPHHYNSHQGTIKSIDEYFDQRVFKRNTGTGNNNASDYEKQEMAEEIDEMIKETQKTKEKALEKLEEIFERTQMEFTKAKKESLEEIERETKRNFDLIETAQNVLSQLKTQKDLSTEQIKLVKSALELLGVPGTKLNPEIFGVFSKISSLEASTGITKGNIKEKFQKAKGDFQRHQKELEKSSKESQVKLVMRLSSLFEEMLGEAKSQSSAGFWMNEPNGFDQNARSSQIIEENSSEEIQEVVGLNKRAQNPKNNNGFSMKQEPNSILKQRIRNSLSSPSDSNDELPEGDNNKKSQSQNQSGLKTRSNRKKILFSSETRQSEKRRFFGFERTSKESLNEGEHKRKRLKNIIEKYSTRHHQEEHRPSVDHAPSILIEESPNCSSMIQTESPKGISESKQKASSFFKSLHDEKLESSIEFSEENALDFQLICSNQNLKSQNFSLDALKKGKNVFYFTGDDDNDFIRVDLGEEKNVQKIIMRAPVYNRNPSKDLKRINGAILQVYENGHWVNLKELWFEEAQKDLVIPIKRKARLFQILRGNKLPPGQSLGIGKLVLI